MSDNVEHVDFGKDAREAARKLSRLLGMVEEHDQLLLENPKLYFDKASAEIARLQGVVRSARDAVRRPVSAEPWKPSDRVEFDTIRVDRGDYERLKAMEAIILKERP